MDIDEAEDLAEKTLRETGFWNDETKNNPQLDIDGE